MAKRLDPDLLPWERQPGESSRMYAAFIKYRDSEKRRVVDHGSTAQRWSAEWQWGYRAYQFDLHMQRVDDEEMIRYRRSMNDRHRVLARVTLSKLGQWVANMDPDRLKPAEAARWAEVAIRVEREAAGASLPEVAVWGDDLSEVEDERTLGELLDWPGLVDAMRAESGGVLGGVPDQGKAEQ